MRSTFSMTLIVSSFYALFSSARAAPLLGILRDLRRSTTCPPSSCSAARRLSDNAVRNSRSDFLTVSSARIHKLNNLLLGAFLAAHSAPALAQVRTATAARPVSRAAALVVAPTIDGNVAADPAWASAEAIDELWQIQPTAGRPATQHTEIFVGYTDTALYIGVIAHDDEPLAIISTDSRRDSSLDDTDSFRVLIDGLLDRQNGYVFGTNPAGIEFDGQISREGQGQSISGGEGGFNLNWDGSWTVRAAVSEIGWSAEMEIPFTSLRFGTEPE
jgi:hypothetical protein